VGAGIWQSQLPPTETLRGVERGTVLLTARDPQALKHQLVGELQAAGVRVSSYERWAGRESTRICRSPVI